MVVIAWDSASVCIELQRACQTLSERCLKLSAKWAAEQWMGLSPDVVSHSEISHDLNIESKIPERLALDFHDKTNPGLFYARTLLDLGEYAHAAAVLSQSSSTKTGSIEHGMPPPISNSSPAALFFRSYALYLAGERQKEEEMLSTDRCTNSMNSEGSAKSSRNITSPPLHICNPYLQQLSVELLDAYVDDHLDAFGLYVYAMVLKATAASGAGRPHIVLPPNSPSAESVLICSILKFPYNWSAWLDLADLVTASSYTRTDQSDDYRDEVPIGSFTRRQVERDIEERLQPELCGHFMYHFFCAHLLQLRQSHSEALLVYERWMDPLFFQGSPYLLSQYAICSYHLRQFEVAKLLLSDLHNHMPYRLDSMDVYSNILYVQEDSAGLSQLAHTAVKVDKYRAETCCIVGNYYSLKQQRAKAIQYFQRALKMDPTFTSAWTLMGHEYVEWKQTANAMQAYRRAVQASPDDYRAWYGLGQTYELLNMNLYALYYYKQSAQLRPYDARMWCAVGMTYAHLHRYDNAIRAYERALQLDENEGIATLKLASLYREKVGQEEKAASCYWRHLEIRYMVTNSDHTFVSYDLLNAETSSLEKMLQHITIESAEAEALLYLANHNRKNGQSDMAIVLLDYAGPEKEDAKAILRELRSRAKAFRSGLRSNTGAAAPFHFSP